jgi:hypothetical protein
MKAMCLNISSFCELYQFIQYFNMKEEPKSMGMSCSQQRSLIFDPKCIATYYKGLAIVLYISFLPYNSIEILNKPHSNFDAQKWPIYVQGFFL